MKKSISRILCAALATALVIPAFAVDGQMQEETKGLKEVSVTDSQVLEEVEISEEPIVPLSDEPHVYTVLPGTEEWVEMTPRERRASCVVSEEEVEGMTTRALVETVVNYPYLVDMYAYDSLDMGIEIVSGRFPGLEELLKRSDALSVLQVYENEQVRLLDAGDEFDLKARIVETLAGYIGETDALGIFGPDTTKIKTPGKSDVLVYVDLTWKNHGYNNFDDDDAAAVCEAYLELYPDATLIGDSNPSYNCHSYAWYRNSESNNYWIKNRDVAVYMTDGGYERVTATKRCKVAYKTTDGECIHSGIISSVGSGPATVESKWGPFGLFSHPINDCPYVGEGIDGDGDQESTVTSCWMLA